MTILSNPLDNQLNQGFSSNNDWLYEYEDFEDFVEVNDNFNIKPDISLSEYNRLY